MKHLILYLCVVLVLSGCSQRQEELVVVEPLCIAGVARSFAIETAADTLGQIHFEIEKSDVEAGIVRSRPLRSAQFFEFWRDDTVGSSNWAESNLHTIRRTVELAIAEQQGQLCID